MPIPEKSATQTPAKVYTLDEPAVPTPEVMPPLGPEPGSQPGAVSQHPQVLLGNTRDGIPVYLSDFQGKLVLVNFWASWCPPCWAEMPELEAIYSEFRHRGVEIIAVNFGETEPAINNFLSRQPRPLSFLIVTDPDAKLAHEQGVHVVPTTLLVNAEGKIVTRYAGVFGFNPKIVRSDLERLLKSAERSQKRL